MDKNELIVAAVTDKRFMARFRSHVQTDDGGGCWLWTNSRNPSGYGQIEYLNMCGSPKRNNLSAHRVAWVAAFGAVPQGMFVCHRCDVRACCNPAHLFLGTAQDNTDDMMNKGRHVADRGSECHNAKVTEEDVVLIRGLRAKGFGPSLIGRLFGLQPCTVTNICSGKQWRHVQ